MFSVGQELYLEIDLKKAKLMQLPVQVVFIDVGEVVKHAGTIEKISNDAVKINGTHYKKNLCRFYVR